MLALAADENFNARIVRGLKRRVPELRILTVQEAGLAGTPDPEVLEWAARLERPLLTHDISTMVGFAWERVGRGTPMAGVLAVPSEASIGQVVEDLALVVRTTEVQGLKDQILFLPL